MRKQASSTSNPADRVIRARMREPIRFADLSERYALKLSAIPQYTAQVHVELSRAYLGGPDFRHHEGVFTPLVYVEIEATDVPVDQVKRLSVRGGSHLAKVPDAAGNVERLVREGSYTILHPHQATELVAGRARMINVFTRYDPDPERRRVTTLPPEWGLSGVPSRVCTLPTVETLIPHGRTPDFAEGETHVWHYEQTDLNRHVTGTEYLRILECYLADILHRSGQDVTQSYFSRARIVYRKPCFRGEGYRCAAWCVHEAPLVLVGAVYKAEDPPSARPAVAIELTLSRHDAG